jgi:hypothetical protein
MQVRYLEIPFCSEKKKAFFRNSAAILIALNYLT